MAFLGQEGPLCDSCFDERISVMTGWPRLPAPPPPKAVIGPHGREHQLCFRLWRTPGGISAEAIEQVPAGEHDDGYALTVFGEDDLPDVVVDGRRLTWVEFGRAVASFEGWWFRLGFGDDVPQPTPTSRAGGSQPG